MIANFIIGFLKTFVLKFFTQQALERLLKVILRQIAESTSTKADDEWFKAIFNESIKNEEK